MIDRLTRAELTERAGVGPNLVDELIRLEIIVPSDGSFSTRDVLRARVVAQLGAMGIEPEAVARALASGHLSLGYLESAGRRHPRSELSFGAVADEIGLPFESIERAYVAFGLVRPGIDERVREEDLAALRIVALLGEAGVEERDVLAMARVWGDSARRVAQYLPHYFHASVEAGYRRRGLNDNAAYEAAIRDVGIRIGRSGEDLLGWLFRRHSEVHLTQHQLEHVETALEEAGVRRRPPPGVEAAAFADLTGYTRLTEEGGDEAAARTAVTLAELVSDVAARHAGSVVKMLGDGVHFHFRDPSDALRASLEIVDRTPAQGLPRVHIGVEAGPMLYEEGDYFGRTVNLAARIASAAAAGQIYVGEALAGLVRQDGFRLVEVGEFDLKGIAVPVRLFECLPA